MNNKETVPYGYTKESIDRTAILVLDLTDAVLVLKNEYTQEQFITINNVYHPHLTKVWRTLQKSTREMNNTLSSLWIVNPPNPKTMEDTPPIPSLKEDVSHLYAKGINPYPHPQPKTKK